MTMKDTSSSLIGALGCALGSVSEILSDYFHKGCMVPIWYIVVLAPSIVSDGMIEWSKHSTSGGLLWQCDSGSKYSRMT